ncbi:hypothetical protein F5X98DRAFT_352514 [Xylaria grammica]|nr:hypothetical protein F5X98DRAFT_352514 [Xylaria grammica]
MLSLPPPKWHLVSVYPSLFLRLLFSLYPQHSPTRWSHSTCGATSPHTSLVVIRPAKTKSVTYDHSHRKTRDPVRSPIDKPV